MSKVELMYHLLRIRERGRAILNRRRGTAGFWPRLLGVTAIVVGLLGLLAHLIGIAPVPYGLGLAVTWAGALFLLSRNEMVGRATRLTLSERSVIWFSILNLALTNAVLVLSFHAERRPTFVFLLMAIQAGLIAVQAFLLPGSSPTTRFLVRLQIVLLQTGIILSRLLVFPEIGVDVWPQKLFAHEIVIGGHFPLADTAYKGYPFWPALIGVITMLVGCTEQDAVLAATVAFASVATWVLLVGLEHAIGYRSSLLVGLILSVSNWFVYWASLAVPMIVTVALFNTILVLLFQRRQEWWLPLTICLLMLLGAGAFYHPMANVASSLLLVTAAVVTWYFSRRAQDERRLLLTAQARWMSVAALVGTILMLSVWMYMGGTFSHLAQVTYRSIQQLEPLSFQGGYRSTLVYELDYLGFHLLLFLAVVRFLRWCVKPARSAFEMTLFGGSLVFLGLNYLGIVTDAFFALPHRWLVFASVLLAFPAAEELGRLVRTRPRGLLLSAAVIMMLALTAVTNTSIDEDNPLYGAEVTSKQGLTSSEAATLQFLDGHTVTYTAVDWQVWNYFRALEDMNFPRSATLDDLLMYYENDTSAMCPDRPATLPEGALVRRIYVNRRVGWTTCSVELSGLAELDKAREFARVYDSGEASFYRRVMKSKVLPGSQ